MDVNIDFGGMAGYIGVIRGVANKSQLYADTMIDAAARKAEREFGVAADVVAKSGSPTNLGHVYEPGQAGNPAARLFSIRMGSHSGRRGGQRDISYVFTPSKIRPRNTPESTGIPANKFPKGLRSQSRVPFWNRALVLETGMAVTIKPRWSKKLFVPNWSRIDGGSNKVSSSAKPLFYFTDRATSFRPMKYVGNFSGFWEAWWQTNADRILQSAIEPIEQSIPKTVDVASKKFSRYGARRGIALYIKEGEKMAEGIIEAELRGNRGI